MDIIYGPEFGLENIGRVALIHWALYGGKFVGRDFCNHLCSCMCHLDFTSCSADLDVWMHLAKKANGSEYYEYILLYVDNALVIGENTNKVLQEELGIYFKLKEGSIGAPKHYLGSQMRKVVLENGVKCWAFGSSQYVQLAVKNVEDYLKEHAKNEDTRFTMPNKAKTPMQSTYRPELNMTPELKPINTAYFQLLIGILYWIVELGQVDV